MQNYLKKKLELYSHLTHSNRSLGGKRVCLFFFLLFFLFFLQISSRSSGEETRQRCWWGASMIRRLRPGTPRRRRRPPLPQTNPRDHFLFSFSPFPKLCFPKEFEKKKLTACQIVFLGVDKRFVDMFEKVLEEDVGTKTLTTCCASWE